MTYHVVVVFGILAVVIALVVCSHYERRYEKVERERRLRALQLADIDNMSGLDFEHYLCRLLIHRGFQAEVTRASGDLGVDIVAQRNGQKHAVQVKRYSNGVSRRAVSDAVAGKQHYGCDSAMVITNSYFTRGAKLLARSTGCELIDREVLTDWILDYQQGGREVGPTARPEPAVEQPRQWLRERLLSMLDNADLYRWRQDWIDNALPFGATFVVVLVLLWCIL